MLKARWPLGTLTIIVLCSLPVRAQGKIPASQIAIHRLNISARDVDGALRLLAKQYRVPIGLVWVESASKKDISIHVEDGTLADALDQLTAADSGIQGWTEGSDGLIRVYSRHAPSLADTTLANFDIDALPQSRVVEMIDDLPEIKQWSAENRCPEHDFAIVMGGPGQAHLSLHASGQSLASVLSALASELDNYFWGVIQYHSKGQCFLAIQF